MAPSTTLQPWGTPARPRSASRPLRAIPVVCSAANSRQRDVATYAARRERVLQRAAEVQALLERMELGQSAEYPLHMPEQAAAAAAEAAPSGQRSYSPARRPAGGYSAGGSSSGSSSRCSSSSSRFSSGMASVGSMAGSSDEEGSDADAGRLTAAPRFVARSRPVTPSSNNISPAAGPIRSYSSPGQGTTHVLRSPLAPLPAAASIKVCTGKACLKQGSAAVLASMQATAAAADAEAPVTGCKCLGRCKKGPNVRVESGLSRQAVVYTHVAPASGAQIVLRHGLGSSTSAAARLAAAAQF